MAARLLLIGNSRWHWAELQDRGLRCWHAAAPLDPGVREGDQLRAWAAVGALPQGLNLPLDRRIQLNDVPLKGVPAWLGIDRALVGWGAWRRQGDAVLVADAGTALSLTRISAEGAFAGGRISAGVALQLRALAAATAQLPRLQAPLTPAADPWPVATVDAMAEGCIRAAAGAVAQAWHDLPAAGRGGLWLTGGDAPLLLPVLEQQQLSPSVAADLALEALASLPAVQLLR